jgi:hypothetical protein
VEEPAIGFPAVAAAVIMVAGDRRLRMTTPGTLTLTALALACGLSPALADGWSWHAADSDRWHAVRHDIYELENQIASLEADPQMDDGFRAPMIASARRQIRWLQAKIAPAYWRWTDPCCYSRRPIHIR